MQKMCPFSKEILQPSYIVDELIPLNSTVTESEDWFTIPLLT
jgi:hypothetical protein